MERNHLKLATKKGCDGVCDYTVGFPWTAFEYNICLRFHSSICFFDVFEQALGKDNPMEYLTGYIEESDRLFFHYCEATLERIEMDAEGLEIDYNSLMVTLKIIENIKQVWQAYKDSNGEVWRNLTEGFVEADD